MSFRAVVVVLGAAMSVGSIRQDAAALATFKAWLVAFNAEDPAQLRAFADRRAAAVAVGNAELRWRSGGYRILSVENAQTQRVSVLLEEVNSDAVARAVMAVDDSQPARVTEWSLQPVARPAEYPVKRLAEAELLDALAARAAHLARTDLFAGAVMIAKHGRPIYQGAWGLANRERSETATTRTRFRLGSLNKVFTAVAVLQLAEKRRISLDAPLGTYPGPTGRVPSDGFLLPPHARLAACV